MPDRLTDRQRDKQTETKEDSEKKYQIKKEEEI